MDIGGWAWSANMAVSNGNDHRRTSIIEKARIKNDLVWDFSQALSLATPVLLQWTHE